MPEQRRIHFTPRWRLFARRWLSTVVCSLAIANLVSGFVWHYTVLSSIQFELQVMHATKLPLLRDWSIPFIETVPLVLLNSGAENHHA